MRVNRGSTAEKWTDPDDAPEISAPDLRRGTWRIRGKRVPPQRGRAELRRMLEKKQINMLLDVAVIEHFKAKAGGRGYQTLINQALWEAINRETLEHTLRRVVREEIRRSTKVA
jgi:uncharacterized protein (DUF4415 family)